jgi:transposase
MVAESRPNYESEYAAITAFAGKPGIDAETLRMWVRQGQIDDGQRPGVSTDESAELKRLRRENAELRRANEILKATRRFGKEWWTPNAAAVVFGLFCAASPWLGACIPAVPRVDYDPSTYIASATVTLNGIGG